MDCSCVAVDIGIDYCPFSTRVHYTARKKHKCNECGRNIIKGESYERITLFYPEIMTQKTCEDCLSIRETFFCDGFYFDSIIDDMRQHVEDCNAEMPWAKLSKLTPAARAKVCEFVEDYWEFYYD